MTDFPILKPQNIKLNMKFANKKEAIIETGKLLVEQGYVENEYIDSMLEREQVISTFMGNYLAIPHGVEGSEKYINHSGISIIQVPEGVEFCEGNIVKLLIGIAGKNGEHLNLLSKIALICSEKENVEKMINAYEKNEILSLLGELS